MNDTNLQVNSQEFISLDEAAQNLGVSTSGLRHYLSRNSALKDKYLKKEIYDGRRKHVISVEALPFITITKNIKSKTGHGVTVSKMKDVVANRTIAQMKPKTSREILNSVIATAQELLKQEEQIEDHEARLSTLEGEDGDLSKLPITQGQRAQIHERVNLLHYELLKNKTFVPQKNIYIKMHEQTGRTSITEYKFEDYKVAKGFLKEWFNKLNIKW